MSVHPVKTKENFLRQGIAAKLAGNAACGCGDPYPHDVEAASCYEAYLALGGTDAGFQVAWREAYNSTPHDRGGGA